VTLHMVLKFVELRLRAASASLGLRNSPSKFLVEWTSQIGRVTKESGKRQAAVRIFAIARIL
jgi:hypothetical protein